MAILELQFRKSAFIRYFISEFNRRRLPFPSSNMFLLPTAVRGAPLERIECVAARIDPTTGEDRITVQSDLLIHYHENLAEVRAAGSLKPGPDHVARMTVGFTVSLLIETNPAGVTKVSLQISLPLGLFPATAMTLPLPPEVTAQIGAVVADDSVVAVRIGTSASDSVTDPIVDRLGADDWAQLISGAALSDVLIASMQHTIEGAATGDVEIEDNASGGWSSPEAYASAELVKVDACVFDIDIYLDLTLRANFQLSGASLTTTLTLSWDVDSTLCDIVGGLVFGFFIGFVINDIAEDEGSKAILGANTGQPGFVQVGQTDESITYKRTTFFSFGGPRFVLVRSAVTAEGLLFAGTLRTPNDLLGLDGYVTVPASNLHTDCGKKQVTVEFDHATVTLHDIGLDGAPRLFPNWTVDAANALFDPPNAWVAVPTTTNSWLDLGVKFIDPPGGRLPAGTATSVFLFTDVGLQWIDLGVIPVDHPQATLGEMAEMISFCMAKSTPWVNGFIEARWLPYPPDVFAEIDPVRLWTVGLQQLTPETHVVIEAVTEAGEVRTVHEISGVVNVAVQVVTSANEYLRLVPSGRIDAPAPVIEQRWMTPYTALGSESAAQTVYAAGNRLGVTAADGTLQLYDLSAAGDPIAIDEASTADLIGAHRLTGQIARGNRRTSQTNFIARLDSGTVAVVHDGVVLIGAVQAPRQMQ